MDRSQRSRSKPANRVTPDPLKTHCLDFSDEGFLCSLRADHKGDCEAWACDINEPLSEKRLVRTWKKRKRLNANQSQ